MEKIETVDLPVGELNLYHKNPRVGNVSVIAESLDTNGQYRAIVVNKGTHTGRPNEVLAGNHTLLAARQLGWTTILAHVIDVDEEQATKIVLVDNRASDVAGMDYDVLLDLASELPDLAGTGYTREDLDEFATFEPKELLTEDDSLPEPPEEVTPLRVAEGDVWALGEHRLACGSADDPDTWVALMGGDKADVVWTDPPYGVDYVGKTEDALTIKNDSLTGLRKLLNATLKLVYEYARDGCPVYMAHPDLNRVLFEQAFVSAGFLFRQNLIWVKNTIVMGRGDYHYQHEPILYGFKPAPAGSGRLGRGGEHWHGDDAQSSVTEAAQALVAFQEGEGKDALMVVDPFKLEDAIRDALQSSTVLRHDKPAASKLHPTMKPVGLVVANLLNSAKRGDIVLDPFAGSGSTLIAAEKLGLRARVIELEPQYAEVVLSRWEEATGETAMKVGSDR
nr:MAG TPA: adenine specific DNA methyltransferase [Caudoviricetes sp.]